MTFLPNRPQLLSGNKKVFIIFAKFPQIDFMKKTYLIIISACLALAVSASCSKNNDQPASTNNPSKYITDPAKRAMITSLTDLDGGRIYTMNYTLDYKLKEAVASGVTNSTTFGICMSNLLYDVTSAPKLSFGVGCSSYAAKLSPNGQYVMGRNYDYCHKVGESELATALLVVFTAPEGGKKTVGFVDAYWLGLHKGFYNDGTTDLSSLMMAPYLIVDGMNEDGLAFSTLALDGMPTDQNEVGKQDIYVSVVTRAMLDSCSTVAQAIAFLKKYNMHMTTAATCSLHYMLADANGDYAIVEWSFKDPMHVDETSVPDYFVTMQADTNRYVTNFYVDPRLKNCIYGGLSDHGRDRYNILRDTLQFRSYILTEQQAASLLKAVSQDPDPQKATSHTQWSNVYNLIKRSVKTSILQEYDKWYEFSALGQ